MRNVLAAPPRVLLVALVLVTGALACNAGFAAPSTPAPPTDTVPAPEAEAPPADEVPAEPDTADVPPPAAPAPAPGLESVNTGSIRFSYDPSLASSIRVETIPAEDMGQDDPGWVNMPEHVQVSFEGYILPGTFHAPRLAVYPVAEFEAMNPTAASTISDLRALLAAQPAAPDEIPFLPVFNAAQFMRAQVTYLPFQNGTGVRFLTQYGQAAFPINNTDLFYTFQGLTSDGSLYVSVILPVSLPTLPADGSGTMTDDFYNNFMDYLVTMEEQLDELPASSFTPDLALLDALVQSIHAGP